MEMEKQTDTMNSEGKALVNERALVLGTIPVDIIIFDLRRARLPV